DVALPSALPLPPPWLLPPPWPLPLLLFLPLPVPLLLSLPLLFPSALSLPVVDLLPSLACCPCWLANALTQAPMPRVPDALRSSLHVCTVWCTCWPQSAGLTLPVTATSVAAPAAAAAKAATAKPVSPLTLSAAPAPPRRRLVIPRDASVLRGGMGAAPIGSRIRCSSRSRSRSNSPLPFIGKRELEAGQNYPFFIWAGSAPTAAGGGRGRRRGEKPPSARAPRGRSRSRGWCSHGSVEARSPPTASAAASAALWPDPIVRAAPQGPRARQGIWRAA